MSIYTATLAAQNTSAYLCDIVKPRAFAEFFANVMASGTFGGGTVTISASIDGGTTKIPLTQDGTATSATLTAAGALNIKCGFSDLLATPVKMYAAIGAATNPSLAITVIDNR